MRNYCIISPPYEVTSGGIRVMHALRSWLEIKGQIVFMNATIQGDNKFIAVYPEIYQGNPAKATKVVRYILNKPGVMSLYGQPSPTEFPKEDEIFVFSKIYDTFEVDEDHIMFLPILNLHLFKYVDQKRPNRCVFYGHQKNVPEYKEIRGLQVIDRTFANDQTKLAEYLNTCDIMYSYETISAMHEIARLCGCRVMLLNSPKAKELYDVYEPGPYGMLFGRDDATEYNIEGFRNHYKNLVRDFDTKIDRFIEITQHD